LRKWLRIVLFSALGLLLLAAAGLFLVWKASRHVPDFYQEAVRGDPAALGEASDEMIRRATVLSSDLNQEGRWEATFTADEINGWLAVDLVENHPGQLPPAMSDPRVAIEPDGLTLACRFKQGYVDTVLSLTVDAYLAEPNVVALRIRKARAGSLPLPLSAVLKRIDEAARRSRLGINWRQADGDPVAYLSLPSSDGQKEVVQIDTVRLDKGEIYVAGSTEQNE
jgi:hypothetical protein